MDDEVAGEGAGEGPGASGREQAQERRRRLRLHLPLSGEEENVAARLAHQWVQLREERRAELAAELAPVTGGRSNFRPAQVPWGVDLAAAWAWRFLVIAAAGFVLVRTVGFFSVVALPLAIALLITALVVPLVSLLDRAGLPRGLASILVVLGLFGAVGALLTFAGQQVAARFSDLADQTVKGLGKVKDWLIEGPLDASAAQINDWVDQAQRGVQNWSRDGAVSGVTEAGSVLGHTVAGFFIILFATYFFLADGARIWSWMVRLAPRAAREQVDASGRVAWVSLTQFVRATVIVAAVDSIGVMIVAAFLHVPFVLAIGVLVFLGAFVPMIGATVAGSVAVLVALVDSGPITALLMLGGVILVQQVEGHFLQPFLMGRWVSLHPLAVIVVIAVGVLAGGVAGALVAVPLAAAVNAVVLHLSAAGGPPSEEAPLSEPPDPAPSADPQADPEAGPEERP